MPNLAGNLAEPVPDKLRRHLNRENAYILVVAYPPEPFRFTATCAG